MQHSDLIDDWKVLGTNKNSHSCHRQWLQVVLIARLYSASPGGSIPVLSTKTKTDFQHDWTVPVADTSVSSMDNMPSTVQSFPKVCLRRPLENFKCFSTFRFSDTLGTSHYIRINWTFFSQFSVKFSLCQNAYFSQFLTDKITWKNAHKRQICWFSEVAKPFPSILVSLFQMQDSWSLPWVFDITYIQFKNSIRIYKYKTT